MTSRDYVKAAIAHQETDRVPYRIGFCGDTWDALRKRARDDAGNNLLGLNPTCSPEQFLDNDVVGMGPPWWSWFDLKPDWREMQAPQSPATVIGAGNYADFIDSVKRTSSETGKYVLVLIYGSHFEKAYFSRGIENFLADLAGERDFARRLLNRIIEKNLVMLENFLAVPEIDGVLLGSDWGSQLDLLMSPDIWHDLIAPGEKREYDLIHSYGKDVWVHSCGNVERILPALIDMGVDVLNPVQPEAMDIRKLKTLYGSRLTFWGGISTQKTLPYGSPEEVKEEARAVRDMMASGGGYILAPSQEIQNDVPPENIRALLEVAREKRRIPGKGYPEGTHDGK